jgi:hypothetical protein
VTGPLDRLLRPAPVAADPALLAALARASAGFARLDQATTGHPLLPALLHRSRLEAVRRQAAVDGQLIDPWQLAALLEGLRPRRLGEARSIAEAGDVFEAGRMALTLHRWLTTPDFDEEGQVREALDVLRSNQPSGVALLDAAAGVWGWLDQGGARPPLRAALVRTWTATRLLRAPLPLTGAAALRPEVAWQPESWIPVMLQALADEADATLGLLGELERGWLVARSAVAGRRRHSRAPAAIDLLAATPLLSATTLAGALGMAIKNALALLEQLVGLGVVVEVTGRSARRLFGLRGLAPLARAVAPPRRPEPGRGRGRPRQIPVEDVAPVGEGAIAPLGSLVRQRFDYDELEEAMAAIDATIRRTRHALQTLAEDQAPSTVAPTHRGDITPPAASDPIGVDPDRDPPHAE